MSLINPDNKIEHPYELSKDEELVLNNHPPKNADDWTKSEYDKLKANIKFHYSVVQNDICPYCRTDLRRNGYGEPLEHIVPKKDCPQWMFTPINLSLACYGCNTKKNKTNTLKNSEITDDDIYPTDSDDFLIIHPHLDNFSKHIIIKYKFFYFSDSEKGLNTIKTCDLNRLDLLFFKAKQSGLTHENVILEYLRMLQTLPGIEIQVVDHIVKMIKDIKRRYDYKKKIGIL